MAFACSLVKIDVFCLYLTLIKNQKTMFEQLTQLVQQFGQQDVVENAAVPNEHNEAVMSEASASIIDGLKNIAAQNGGSALIGKLFEGTNASDATNPVVAMITNQLSGSLGQKLGLDSAAASGVAASLIPKVLGALVGGAKDPNNSQIQLNDVIASITGGGANAGGLMEMVTKYGGMVGLDQNGDGKVDVADAMSAISGKSGSSGGLLGGIFGKLFGK